MIELPDFVALELELLQVPLSRIVCLLELPSWNEDQKTAFGTYIQNIYTGIERIFKYRHVHGYGHMLDESKLRELAAPISETFRLFSGHLTNKQ